MADTTTAAEFAELADIIGVSDRALRNNGLKLENTPEQNQLMLYAWENKQLEAARVANDKAARIHKAAFHLAKGEVAS